MSDETIIASLLSKPTVSEAAKSLGITPQTIYNKMRDDRFRQQYAEARKLMLDENCYKLQGYVSEAIETLARICSNDLEKAQIRINAADAVMRHCYRLTELCDILGRLEALEKVVDVRV